MADKARCGTRCFLLLLVAAFCPLSAPAADDPPPAPAAFGIRLGVQTTEVHALMHKAGYRSQEMRLDSGCVVESFVHSSPDAVMPRADIWLCGPERRVACWEIEGQASRDFYSAARERFGLDVRQKQGEAVSAGFGNYARTFANDVRLTITNTRGIARLRLENPAALHSSAAEQEKAVQYLDTTAAEQKQRQHQQRESLF